MSPASGQRVAIVTDTTASLSPEWVAAHDVPLVPQVILFGEKSFLEGRELSFDAFLERLVRAESLPRTAAPPPGEFLRVYDHLVGRFETILSIHPASEVSGTVRSAQMAVDAAYSGEDIRIIDTRTIGGALGALVRVAVRLAEEGWDGDGIEERLRAMIPQSRTYFAVKTLEYLERGGRIGRASALLGSVLRIRPLLEFRDGQVDVCEKVRTFRRAVARMRARMLETCPRRADAYPTVMHSGNREAARALARELGAALGVDEIPVVAVGSAITTHAGPGVLGVSFFADAT